jgi:hypothetical protein
MRFRLYQGNVWAFSDSGAWVLQTNGAIEPQYWHWEALTQQQEAEMEEIIDKAESRKSL